LKKSNLEKPEKPIPWPMPSKAMMAEKPNTETRSKLFLERKTPLKKLRSRTALNKQFKQRLPLATVGVFAFIRPVPKVKPVLI